MKKIIGLILVFCLLFTFTADAFAAGKPKITKQPVNGTVKKGKVSFQVKVSGSVDSISWYLINPDTGEAVTAKKLKKDKTFPKLVISGENRSKLSLSKVPDEMHGWSVYCHISGNGYKIDSDIVMILVDGMEAPETDTPDKPDDKAPAEDTPPADDSSPEDTGDTGKEKPDTGNTDEDEPEETKPANSVVKVTSSAKVLYQIDASGKISDEKATSKLEFNGPGSFMVKSDEPITSWSANGVRFEPSEPVYEFKVSNVTSDLSLDFNVQKKAASSTVVDESKPCKVTCEGCTFTCIPKQLYSVSEGEVPSGSLITVTAGNSALTKNGYVINGSEPDYQDKTSFSVTVEEDMKIVLK
jgi:hypothetical protein